MSRLEQQFKDLRIITGRESLNEFTSPTNPLSTSHSTRTVNPIYHSNFIGINQSYMLLTSPNRNHSTQNLQLSVPKATSPLLKGNTSKLKKHISFINNSFNYPNASLAKHTRSITSTAPSSPSSVRNQHIITSHNNKPPVNVDNSKFEFSARTYMINSPTSRATPTQPLFRGAKPRNAFALFKSKPTATPNKNLFNQSERRSHLANISKRKEMLINTNVYADKIKHQLRHGGYNETSSEDKDLNLFAKELKAWTNKKESEWKQLY